MLCRRESRRKALNHPCEEQREQRRFRSAGGLHCIDLYAGAQGGGLGTGGFAVGRMVCRVLFALFPDSLTWASGKFRPVIDRAAGSKRSDFSRLRSGHLLSA